MFRLFANFTSIGKLFQSLGPRYERALCPTLVLRKGISNLWSEFRVFFVTFLGVKISDISRRRTIKGIIGCDAYALVHSLIYGKPIDILKFFFA